MPSNRKTCASLGMLATWELDRPSARQDPVSSLSSLCPLFPTAQLALPGGNAAGSAAFSPCCADMSHLTTLAGGGHLRSALLLRCRGAQKTKEKPRLLSLSSSYERPSSGPCTRPDSCRANSTHPLDPTSPTPWLASRLNAGFPSPSSPTGARASSRSRRSSRQGRCHSDPLLECRHAVRSALRLPE